MLKILQARLQQYVNHEIPDVQAGFRKSRRTRALSVDPAPRAPSPGYGQFPLRQEAAENVTEVFLTRIIQEPEIKLSTSVGSSEKEEFQKNIYFCFIDYAKAFV